MSRSETCEIGRKSEFGFVQQDQKLLGHVPKAPNAGETLQKNSTSFFNLFLIKKCKSTCKKFTQIDWKSSEIHSEALTTSSHMPPAPPAPFPPTDPPPAGGCAWEPLSRPGPGVQNSRSGAGPGARPGTGTGGPFTRIRVNWPPPRGAKRPGGAAEGGAGDFQGDSLGSGGGGPRGAGCNRPSC